MEENRLRDKWMRIIVTSLALLFTMTVLFFVNGEHVLSDFVRGLGIYPDEVCEDILTQFETYYYYQEAFDEAYKTDKQKLLSSDYIKIKDLEAFIYNVTDEQKDEFTFFVYNDPPRGVFNYDYIQNASDEDEFYACQFENAFAYIRFLSFNEGTADKVTSAMEAFSQTGIKHLVIDLRDNGGGLVMEANTILDALIEECSTLRLSFNDKSEYILHSAPGHITFNRITVLLNKDSASASEMIALGLKNQLPDVVELLGDKTYGKGVTQAYYEDEGYELALFIVDSKWDYHAEGIPELYKKIEKCIIPAFDANQQKFFLRNLSESINMKR